LGAQRQRAFRNIDIAQGAAIVIVIVILNVAGHALIAVALGYPHLAQAGPSSPAGPLLAGLILWASASTTLVHTMRRRSLES
jgi:hypothetical protein